MTTPTKLELQPSSRLNLVFPLWRQSSPYSAGLVGIHSTDTHDHISHGQVLLAIDHSEAHFRPGGDVVKWNSLHGRE